MSSDKLFGQWVQEQEFGFNRQWAWVLMQAAKQEREVRLLSTQVVSRGEDINFRKLVSCVRNGGQYNSESSVEWRTPKEIVRRVEKVLGAIDLDPCADQNKLVRAARHYTKADDGLSREWTGRVFVNPPYGTAIGSWVEKLCAEYKTKRVKEAIAFVPASVDTEWFSMLRDFAVCFLRNRVKFGASDNRLPGSAPFPSALFYLGKNVATFAQVFNEIGDIWVLWKP